MESVREEWRPVVGHEGKFEVSNLGRVKSLSHEVRHWCGRMIPKPERIVTASRHSGGYRVVCLGDGRKSYVHRLVAEAFIGQAATGQDVNHIDGDKSNNSLENLEYCNRLHNVRHAIATGLQDNAGEGNGMHRFTAEQISAAHQLMYRGATYVEVANAFGMSASHAESIAKGRCWRHLGLRPIHEIAGA